MNGAVILKNVDIVYGAKPKKAFPLIDEGASRDDINARTSLIAGALNASLTVEAGDRMLRVACTTERATYTPLYLPVRVLPGQTVDVYYTAPRTKKRPATLGFTPI